jgi:predicted nucleic acid-binding protein
MYLLDTNVVSELRRPKPHGGLVAWLRGVEDRHLHLSAVTLGEIQAGIEITREQDSHKADEIETWADQVAVTWNVLAMDGAAFRLWGRMMHRRPDRLMEDAMIAATARLHGLTLVTRNVKDFKEFGVTLLNPFAAR